MAEVLAKRDKVDTDVFEAIAKLGTKESLAALKRSARQLSVWSPVHKVYAAAIEYRGDLEGEAIQWVSGVVMSTKESTHRLAAAKALASFEDRALESLEDVFARHRYDVIKGIVFQPLIPHRAKEGTPKAVASILDFGNLREPRSRAAVIQALMDCESPKIDSLLIKRLKGRETSTLLREVLLTVLADRQSKGVDKALLAVLDRPEYPLQVRALEILASRGDASVARKVEKHVPSRHRVVSREAVVTLDSLKGEDKGWTKSLLRYTKSKDSGVRMGALAALAGVPGEESLEAIHGLFEDPIWGVRVEAYGAAVKVGAQESVPLLKARVDEETGRVRRDLIELLGELTGTGPSPDTATYANGDPWPQLFGIPCASHKVGILVDCSRSMGNALKAKPWSGESRLKVVAQEVEEFIAGLAFGGFVALAYVDDHLRVPELEGTRDTLIDLRNFLRDRRPGNGSWDLEKGLDWILTSDVDSILIIADGDPTYGRLIDPNLLIQRYEQRHRANKVRIHGIALGRELPLLQGLAGATGGEYRSYQ